MSEGAIAEVLAGEATWALERLRAEENGLTLRDARAGQLPMFPG